MRVLEKKRRKKKREKRGRKRGKREEEKKGEIPSFPKLIKVSDFILFSYIIFHS